MANDNMLERGDSLQNTPAMHDPVPVGETPPEGHQMSIGGGTAAGRQPHRGEAPHWGRRALLTGGALLAAVGIGFGADKVMNSSDDNPDSGVAPLVTPDAEPPKTPTVEATQVKVIENYPLELGKTIEFGNVEFHLTSDLMNVGALIDVNTGTNRKEGLKVQDVILNPEVPDAQQKLDSAILNGEFLAWRSENPERSEITFEQFKEKIEDGEDVTFSLHGYKDGKLLAEKGDFNVDPRKKTHIVLLSTPSANIKPFAGSNYGYRSLNGELYIELYDYKAFGLGDKVHADSDLDVAIQWSLALMSEKDIQKSENIVSQSDFARVENKMRSFDHYLVPNKGQDYWQGTLLVR